MDDKNLHIDPSLNQEYPDPGIPVNQAWESMQLLLDNSDLPAPVNNPKGAYFS